MATTLPESIESERLILRAPTIADAQAIYDGWASDPECSHFLIWRPHNSIDETLGFLHRVLDGSEPEMGRPWLLTRREDGAILGMIDLRLTDHRGEIGYVLARSAWGHGYGTEAARAVIAVGLTQPGVFRVWATCDVDNLRSAHVLEKAGMRREGLLRRYMVHPNIDPEPRDAYIFAKTK